MRFPRAARRRRAEAVVPMINVVFLLLIFFLMTAVIEPPAPFDLDLPAGAQEEREAGEAVLFVSAGGVVGFDGALGEAAWGRLSEVGSAEAVTVRADAALPAAEAARVLARLGAMGLPEVQLMVRAP